MTNSSEIRWAIGLLAAVLAITALGWAMVRLQGIFEQERNAAISELNARRSVLAQFAVNALQQKLSRDMRAAWRKMQLLRRDPLLSSGQYAYIVDQQQRLPKVTRYGDYESPEATALYQRLTKAGVLDLLTTKLDAWSVRLNQLGELKNALEQQDIELIQTSFNRLRELFDRDNVDAFHDIPFRVAALQFLIQHQTPGKTVLTEMLRGGDYLLQNQKRLGLQRALLAHRSTFNREDFEFLAARIIEISLLYDVRVDDFIYRSQENRRARNWPKVTTPLLTADGHWYLEPFAENGTRGMRIQPEEVVLSIQNDMLFLGLLDDADLLEMSIEQTTPLEQANIEIQSFIWPQRRHAIDEHYRIKTALLYLSGLFALALVFLMGLYIYRQKQFVDLKADFVATVSHELRTPLASMRLISETLMRKFKDQSVVKDYPQRILSDIDQMSFLVENILSFNRLAKSTVSLHRQKVSLEDLVSDLQGKVTTMTSKPVEITTQGVEGCFANADEELLGIVFNNLMTNACKYNDKSRVTVHIEAGTNTVVFSDNGCGIPESLWSKVFEEFYRYVSAERPSVRGTGLGLALCKTIMGLHGGGIKITASSAQGTAFLLSFPKPFERQAP